MWLDFFYFTLSIFTTSLALQFLKDIQDKSSVFLLLIQIIYNFKFV